MTRSLRTLIFLLTFCPMTFLPLPVMQPAMVYAAEDSKAAEAKIVGPTEGVPGDIIYLDFSESVANKIKCVVEPSRFSDGKATFRLDSPDPKLEPEAAAKGPRGLYLASRPMTYRVSLLVSNETGPDMLVFTVMITSPTPLPPAPKPIDPVPPTPPNPVNPLPADKFGLAEWVRTQVLSNVPPEKRYLCTQFSGNFTQVKIAPFTSFVDAMARATKLNNITEGTDKATWTTNVFTPLVSKLKALIASKTLVYTDLSEVRLALDAIAVGFAGAAQ